MAYRELEPLKRILYRFLQDLLTESLPEYWERRAKTFAEVGNPECDLVALACRRHASLLRTYGPDPDILAVINDALDHHEEAA